MSDAEHLGGGVVLLRGAAVRDAYLTVSIGLRKMKEGGYSIKRPLIELQNELQIGVLAATDELSKRRDDVAETPIEAGCSIGSAEASEILGISRRQVQRLAKTLGGRRGHAGVLEFDVHEITAYGATRLAA
ncbi:hypothetical protein JCM9803A_11900 [Rhodococcus erythropolis]